jgi:ABC-type sugar transport system ATPase subunit
VSNQQEYILETKDISKSFPGVKALDHVSIQVKPGEVLAVVGENGAGKSTLMKTLVGLHKPDSGSGDIILDGEPVRFHDPLDAKKSGLIIIFQELSLVKELSVAENIFLGNLPKGGLGTVDWKALNEKTREILDKMELDIEPTELIARLSIGRQQMVEIARALSVGAKVVIFDEPTSSLTTAEKDILFRNIRRLKENNVAVIYITHKMDEVFEITDRIAVLRDGKNRGVLTTKEANLEDVTQLMIGRVLDDYFHKNEAEKGKEILRVDGLTKEGLFEDISFDVREGEVVGLYGLVGAGRSEVVETIFGARQEDAGDIYLNGKKRKIKSTRDAVSCGIGLVPEDRKLQGLVLKMSCKENITLAKLPLLTNNGFIDNRQEMKLYQEYKDKLSIATPGHEQQVVNLSGGNQQKIVIGKWMSLAPRLFILDEPTRGIDVGSKAEIHKLIAKLAESNLAVLVISSEMPEIMGICDRIITMREGKVSGEFSGADVTEENLIKAIAHTEGVEKVGA